MCTVNSRGVGIDAAVAFDMPSKQQALDALFASFRPAAPKPVETPPTPPAPAAAPPARRKEAVAAATSSVAPAAATSSVVSAKALPKKKKKRKTKSGDARRRAKKAKLAAAAATDRSPPAPAAAAAPTAVATKKTKKRHRTNAKCKCNRCGRNLQKKNLREHLKRCDGTRPEHNPNHVNSRVRKEEEKTDGALETMFADHCAAHGLAGTDKDFAEWSEAMLADANGTMQKAKEVRNMASAATGSVSASAVAEPPRISAPVRSEFGGKKKSFGSDSEESDSGEDE